MNGNGLHHPGDGLDDSKAAQPLRDGALHPLRDRFELLSAYLDGEITAAERRQIEDWLTNDPSVQCLYARLLKLRQGLRSLPVPAASQPVEQTVQQVFAGLERRPRRTMVWGSVAIAAMFIGAIWGKAPQAPQTVVNLLQSPETGSAASADPSEGLMIALDRPVVEIPKAPISVPDAAIDQSF